MSSGNVSVHKSDVQVLKSMANPHQAIKDVLVATSILLGNTKHSDPYRDWMNIKKMMADTNFLTMLLSECKPSPEAVEEAKKLLEPYNEASLKPKAHAILGIYQWNLMKIKEAGGSS